MCIYGCFNMFSSSATDSADFHARSKSPEKCTCCQRGTYAEQKRRPVKMSGPAEDKRQSAEMMFDAEEVSAYYESFMHHNREAMKVFLERYKDSFFAVENGVQCADRQWLDVGCGPGKFTKNYLLPHAPSSLRRLVAADFSQAMLDHAARNHAHPKIAYRLLDIANDKAVSAFAAREGLFERVCCFLTLHWISDKAAALRNLEYLTAPGGECLVVFNPRVAPQQVLRAMIASGKWKRHEHVLKYALPESWEFYDVDTMVSKLEGLVASTSLVALSCEVVPLQVGSPEIDLEVRALCAAIPIYPHMKKEGQVEVEEFVRNLALQDGCVNFSVTGITHQLRCVIHARKPVLSS
ncbi:juvenile hormone acid O-methyltransferase-like isoform X1 [Dermacentor andersoni]|uniref:juvenile hormone acid O-methyltransferase-like isoform X1 n=1 Tax=Dermacentor andersoni TaxID=34620 RepID=UPI0024159CB9|nr:juvenile hormone acid O-methyltransferase-like isoform X1 [Dermacentor andersoni]